jgi:hypothetical protein
MVMSKQNDINNKTSYEKDFYAWTIRNAGLLRKKQFSKVDVAHIAEEIEDMGKSEKRQLVHRLAILIAHLLKWEFQPKRRTKSWKLTITHQRLKVKKLLQESPSLKHELEAQLTDAYEDGLFIAAEETRLSLDDFPTKPMYTLEQFLNDDFFPR